MKTLNVISQRRVFTLALALGCLAAAGTRPVSAAYLSFNLNADSSAGRVAYAGGATPLVGKDLGVLSVKGLDTKLNPNGLLALSHGSVDFSTGIFSAAVPTSATGSTPPEYRFGSGGNMTVSGGIPSLGIPDGSALLTGQFSEASFLRPLAGTDLKVTGGAFFNVVNDKLAAYFGLPAGATAYVGGISTMFAAPAGANGSFTSSGYASGLVTTTPVPEPTTLVLFGVLSAGGIVWSRRGRPVA